MRNGYSVEMADVNDLREHPRNYRDHPDDQLDHLETSVREHSLYRNVVVARDGTILAGHGVVKTLRRMGVERVPVVRLDLDPDSTEALGVLTGDNEISRLAKVADRDLVRILEEIDEEVDLLGTGYDDKMLSALSFTARPAKNVDQMSPWNEWVGMPEYDPGVRRLRVEIEFDDEGDREAFLALIGLEKTDVMAYENGDTWSSWWPPTGRDDLSSLKFEEVA